MNKILIRYNEIYLKGKNRSSFERMLLANIKTQLSEFDFNLQRMPGRILLEEYSKSDETRIVTALKRVMGIYSVSIVKTCVAEFSEIAKLAVQESVAGKTFRVTAKRADKTFPMNSGELAAKIGAYILEQFPDLKVDLTAPESVIHVEIRENNTAYVYSNIIRCEGGLPVGCSGKGLLMLSGGIDSPVAGYMMARRGMQIEGLHFYSYPYTSMQAKEKVITLSELLKQYTLTLPLMVVPFTEIQDAIHKCCKDEFMVILMRRMMMRIANEVAAKRGLQTIITGENLAQVASQTIESIAVTNQLAAFPVMRPLIGFDKIDIIEAAKKIGTFDTSILPYEDCCTIFLPKRPVIKPKLAEVEKEEAKLSIDALIRGAVDNIEYIE